VASSSDRNADSSISGIEAVVRGRAEDDDVPGRLDAAEPLAEEEADESDESMRRGIGSLRDELASSSSSSE
jgi:hypothetical protein